MTPLRGETGRSLAGAVRLLGFRTEGLGYLSGDPGAAWRSFFSLVLVAPAFMLMLGSQRDLLQLEPVGPHFIAVWALTYLVLSFAFPLALLLLSERQAFATAAPAAIVALNWVSVPAAYIRLGTLLAGDAGLLSGAEDLVEVGFYVWMLMLQWWLFRQILKVGGGQAAALVVLAELLNFAIFLWGTSSTAAPLAALGAQS